MAYVDTNVIISFYFDDERGHEIARKIVDRLRGRNTRLYASPLTIVELFSAVSRKLPNLRLPPHVEIIVKELKPDEKTIVHILIGSMLESLNITVVDDDPIFDLFDLFDNRVRMFYIFRKAIENSVSLKLRTLDLIHVSYALQLASKGLLDTFVTLDKEIIDERDLIIKLGLNLEPPLDDM
jgi:predicted nucleic acid-binding protein